MHRIKNELYLGFFIAFLLSSAAELSSYVSFKNQYGLNGRVIHSYQVLSVAQNIQKLIIDMETGERGSRATNDNRFLQPYTEGLSHISPEIGKLKKLVSDNPDQENKVVTLENNIAGLLHFWTDNGKGNSIHTKQQLESITNNEKLQMDEIRGNISNLLDAEKILLNEKYNKQSYSIKIATWVSIAGTALTLGIIALLIAIFIKEVKNHKVNIEHLNQLNNDLAFQILEKEEHALELTKVNRLYAFISQINQTIVKVKDQKTLFKSTCSIAIEFGKFNMAWIGFIDKEYMKIRIIESCNILQEDTQLFNDVCGRENGPQHFVLNSGKPFICNDIEREPELLPWRHYAEARGINSFIVLPIRRGGSIIGTLNLYALEKDLFDNQEIRLLEEAAGDISFALDVFEKEDHRKQMEEETGHSRLRLNQAQAIAHVGSWELDISTGIGKWSKEGCRIYGIPLDDNILSYQSWLSYIHPDDLNYVIKVTKEGERTLTSSAFYHRIVLKNGTVKHICSESHFDFSKEGKPLGLYGIVQDVTKSKQLENERAKITADILQRNNDLEQFSYIVSHNLRAPVANILGLVDIIQANGIDKDEAKVIEFLGDATKNLDNVIKDINHILELKHGVNEVKERLIFEELLSEVKLSIHNVLHAEQVNIISDFSEAQEIFTIKSYLYSIFINLISNSVKYRQPGMLPIIGIYSQKINNKIQLTFKDNGLGIDLAKEGDEVFGLYKRFHYHVEGKGMGLYMVKSQVELLGGKITIISDVNKGSEFKIAFDESRG